MAVRHHADGLHVSAATSWYISYSFLRIRRQAGVGNCGLSRGIGCPGRRRILLFDRPLQQRPVRPDVPRSTSTSGGGAEAGLLDAAHLL